MLKPCRPSDFEAIHQVINEAATAYKGVIPADCYHEPYMAREKLHNEIEAGVAFWGKFEGDELVGVMGIQPVEDVHLIRHAYVRTSQQGKGTGTQLMEHLIRQTPGTLLVGAWADAHWAIGFYQKHRFLLTDEAEKNNLLQRYWNVPGRQRETSVVLRRVSG